MAPKPKPKRKKKAAAKAVVVMKVAAKPAKSAKATVQFAPSAAALEDKKAREKKDPEYEDIFQYNAAMPMKAMTLEEHKAKLLEEGPPEAHGWKPPTLDDYRGFAAMAIRSLEHRKEYQYQCHKWSLQLSDIYVDCMRTGDVEPIKAFMRELEVYTIVAWPKETRPTWPNNDISDHVMQSIHEDYLHNFKTARVMNGLVARMNKGS